MKIKRFLFWVSVAALVFLGAGCKKDQANFMGNYFGVLNYAGAALPDTFKVTATSNPQQVIIYDVRDSVYLTATLSGNNIIGISGSYPGGSGFSVTTFTGHGNLAGNTLTITLYDAYTYNSVQYVDSAVFVGAK